MSSSQRIALAIGLVGIAVLVEGCSTSALSLSGGKEARLACHWYEQQFRQVGPYSVGTAEAFASARASAQSAAAQNAHWLPLSRAINDLTGPNRDSALAGAGNPHDVPELVDACASVGAPLPRGTSRP